MKKMFLIIAAVFVTASTIFAPTQRFFAINHETRQCAGYWGGDEYVSYKLPSDWVIFEYRLLYPKGGIDHGSFEVETDIGICHVPWQGQISSEKSCCSELGYTYLAENIGIRENTAVQEAQIVIMMLVGMASILIIIAVGLWLYRKKNNKNLSEK